MHVQDLFGMLMVVIPPTKREAIVRYYFKGVMENNTLMKEISKKCAHQKIPKHEKVSK